MKLINKSSIPGDEKYLVFGKNKLRQLKQMLPDMGVSKTFPVTDKYGTANIRLNHPPTGNGKRHMDETFDTVTVERKVRHYYTSRTRAYSGPIDLYKWAMNFMLEDNGTDLCVCNTGPDDPENLTHGDVCLIAPLSRTAAAIDSFFIEDALDAGVFRSKATIAHGVPAPVTGYDNYHAPADFSGILYDQPDSGSWQQYYGPYVIRPGQFFPVFIMRFNRNDDHAGSAIETYAQNRERFLGFIREGKEEMLNRLATGLPDSVIRGSLMTKPTSLTGNLYPVMEPAFDVTRSFNAVRLSDSSLRIDVTLSYSHSDRTFSESGSVQIDGVSFYGDGPFEFYETASYRLTYRSLPTSLDPAARGLYYDTMDRLDKYVAFALLHKNFVATDGVLSGYPAAARAFSAGLSCINGTIDVDANQNRIDADVSVVPSTVFAGLDHRISEVRYSYDKNNAVNWQYGTSTHLCRTFATDGEKILIAPVRYINDEIGEVVCLYENGAAAYLKSVFFRSDGFMPGVDLDAQIMSELDAVAAGITRIIVPGYATARYDAGAGWIRDYQYFGFEQPVSIDIEPGSIDESTGTPNFVCCSFSAAYKGTAEKLVDQVKDGLSPLYAAVDKALKQGKVKEG